MDDSLKLLGRRWAAPVVMELLNGRDRFNTLLEAIPGINPRTLSARLDDLERLGIIRREARDSEPVRVHYALTTKGQEMKGLFLEMASFSLRWFGRSG